MDNSLNWDISQNYIYNDQGQPIEGYKAIYNNESRELLNIAKDSYTPISNDLFLNIVQTLNNSLGFELTGFESFKGGRKVLAYLKNPHTPNMVGLKASNYMVIGNSHDSSTSFFSGFTNVVHRCTNMFSQKNMQMRVHHTADIHNRIDDMIETIDFFYDAEQKVYRQMEDFERTPIYQEQKINLVENLLDFKMKDWEQISTRKKNTAESMFLSIERETLELGNSLFGLFNGITHYSSHVLKSKTKVFGSPFGKAADINQKTLNWCQNHIKKAPEPLKIVHI